jgi:murein DD-endopeptidase MepM/ murein hydrolase activator NlpD
VAEAARLRWRIASLLLLVLGAGSSLGIHASEIREVRTRTVRPGQFVAWSAPGTVRCGDGEETWEPDGATCRFPVDLLREGPFEVTRTVGEGAGRRQETLRILVADYPYPEQHLTVAPGHVDLSPENETRAARERERIDALWDLRTPRRFDLPLAAPLSPMPRGGRFGSRRFFNGEPRSPHTGADYAATTGTPVRAVAPGTVKLAEEHFFGGKSVFIDHGDGLISMSLHLSEIAVEPGQEVKAGQVVGEVGATGRVTGPHLHFGVRWRGARVDPEVLFHPDEVARAVD